MKPYGMKRLQYGDDDVGGCTSNARATGVYSTTGKSYKSLRRGKKNAGRRIIKRQARNGAKKEIQNQLKQPPATIPY